MFAQLESLAEVFGGPTCLAEIVVVVSDIAVAQCEIRIELDGPLVVRQRGGRAFLVSRLSAKRVRFQGFERRGSRLCQRNVKLLYGFQRLPQFSPAASMPPRPAYPALPLSPQRSPAPRLACSHSGSSRLSSPARIGCPGWHPDRLGYGDRFERLARGRIAAKQGTKQ